MTDDPDDWVASTLARMGVEQLVGQLFVQYVYGADANSSDPRNTALFGVDTPAAAVRKYRLGGVVYFAWSGNLRHPEQIAALSNGLQAAAPHAGDRTIPLLVAIDQEMGTVTRIGPPATQFPGAMALGATRDPALARVAAAVTGRELRALGINLDFAPCSDVNVDPLNPVIGVRSFGSRAELVAGMVAAQVAGYQDDAGVASATKHFPGHGDTATDSHLGLPVVTHTRQRWDAIDAPPFRAAIAAGVDMVMSAHLAMPAFDDSGAPATLSRPILTGLLRERLGYTGVVVTDSLEMQGVRDRYDAGEVAVRALEAGADQLLMTPAIDTAIAAIMAAVGSGRLSLDQLREKVRRILTLKLRRGIAGNPLAEPGAISATLGTESHRRTAAALTDATVTLVRNEHRLLPFSPAGAAVLVTGCGAAIARPVAEELTARGAAVTLVETGASASVTVLGAGVADPVETGGSGPAADRAAGVAAAASAGLVVVLTNRAWADASQARYVRQLVATGTPVVAVAVRDPYDINALGEVAAYLCTYSDSPVSAPALVRVLAGETRPTGVLPVDIPAAVDPGRMLYAYGSGLTY